MSLALWIVAIVLAVAFAGSGLMKLAVPKDKLVANGQAGRRTSARPSSD
jgi:uncharacterized membrane protein YphA (DoxX/SURF4 family)